MRHASLVIALAALAVAAPAIAKERPIGVETVIQNASNGGIRAFEIESPSIVYLRDRRERWYRVELTGGCFWLTKLRTLSFDTDATGRFDRFSSVRSEQHSCGVVSIKTSAAPRSQPPAPGDAPRPAA